MPSLASNRPTTPDMGTALLFTRIISQKCYETAETAAYRSGPITVMAWTRFQPGTSANPLGIVGKGKATSSNLCWSLAWNPQGTLRIDLSSDGTAGTTVTVTSTHKWNDSARWHHVAFTYVPSTTTATIYVDGVADGTSAAAPATLFASTMPVTIGGTSTAVGTIAFPGTGLIQEAAVVTQALTAAQLALVMAGGARGVLAQIASGATYSVWIIGEDAGINTSALSDFGNAGSGLTLSGTTNDWYGRYRPRMGYGSLAGMPMNGAAETSTILSDATNGWNAVAKPGDFLLVPNGFQNLLTTPGVSVGKLGFAYTMYDTGNSTGGGDGSGLGMLQDINNAIVGTGWGGRLPTALAYDCEVWTNTPATEYNAPVTYMQLACRLAHSNGLLFAAVPSLGLAQQSTNAHDIATITDSLGKPGCDMFFLQTQSHDSSVDEYCSNIFPLCKTIYTASPTTQIWIQVQNFKVGNTKIADQFDLAQIIWNTDTYLRSIGKSDGLNGWGFFIAPGSNTSQLISNWGDLRRFIRPSGRAAATRRYLTVGQVSGATSSTLSDSLQSTTWTTNQWAGRTVYITGGTGDTQSAVIVSNNTTQLTITGTWTTTPDHTSSYGIA